MEVLISKVLIDSNISHDEFVLMNNVLKEYDDMKEISQLQRLNQFIEGFNLFIKQCRRIVWSVEKIQKVKIQNL